MLDTLGSNRVMMLGTHGEIPLRSGRINLKADYHPGDGVVGLLELQIEDQENYCSIEGRIRLDPWIGNEFGLIEFRTGNCFIVCGGHAVVAIDASKLTWLSSVSFEFEEGVTTGCPWYVEIEEARLIVVATERRVWCVDERGAIRWIWSCLTEDRDQWISGSPVRIGDCVRVPISTFGYDLLVEIRLSDGLPEGQPSYVQA